MTVEVCAGLLREKDPDRFGAMLTAAPDRRAGLVALYALNLELARVPFLSAEPILAEMRLQWWIDRLNEMADGVAPPSHDVLTLLWQEWGRKAADLSVLAEARRRDCARESFQDCDAVIGYVDATAGALMWRAALWLGASERGRGVVLDQGRGAGLAAWLLALPELQPVGLGFPTAHTEAARMVAKEGRAALLRAAEGRRLVPGTAAAALYPGPRVYGILADIAEGRVNCFERSPGVSPFRQRASLARLALTGRWWV